MFGSSVLDIGIGLIFVYLLLSLIVTAATEMIAGWFKRRHDNLWQGLVNLLGCPCADKLYQHALIKGLSPPDLIKFKKDILGGYSSPLSENRSWFDQLKLVIRWLFGLVNVEASGPSYIPSRTFAVALLDIIQFKPGDSPEGEIRRILDTLPDSIANVPTLSASEVKAGLLQAMGSPPESPELASLINYMPDTASPALIKAKVLAFLDKTPLPSALSALPTEIHNTDLQSALTLLWKEAGQDVEKFKTAVEHWYNDTMDRVSGWYKRETQLVNFTLAVIFTLIINVDSILIVNTLAKNSALRESIVAKAGKFAEQSGTNSIPAATNLTQTAQSQLQDLDLPIGWVRETNAAPGSVAPDRNHQLYLVLSKDLFWETIAHHWLGWILTAVAVSLGAPFWFDLLSKFIAIRSSGDAPGSKTSQNASVKT